MPKPFNVSSLLLAASALSIVVLPGCSGGDEANLEAELTEVPNLEKADPMSFPDIVATVNGTEIHKDELLERAAGAEADAPPGVETSSVAFFRRVLDEIVGAELLYQSSIEKNGALDPTVIEQQLSVLRGRFPDASSFEQALAREGLTLDELKAQMERDLTIRKLIETDIAPSVSVSDDDKRAFYDDNPERMRQPDRLRLSHILKRVAPDASPETKEAARSALEDILEQARDGADFAALAREHSEDPGSAANGGELTVSRGETVPPFEQAAFALEPGGLSPVVETQFGFHIIKLTERIDGQLVPYDEVEARIEEFLMQQAVQEEIESTVESLKEGASIELFL